MVWSFVKFTTDGSGQDSGHMVLIHGYANVWNLISP